HVVHAAIAGVLKEWVLLDTVGVCRPAQRLLAVGHFTANDDTLNALGLLNILPEGLGHGEEICLRDGHALVSGVPVHHREVARKSRQLPIARSRLGFGLFEVLRNSGATLRTRSHRFVDGFLDRSGILIAQAPSKIGGEPATEAVLTGVTLEIF